jgi:hypothetical protein
MSLSIKYPSGLDLSTSDQMLKYLALHVNITHHISLLEVLVQNDALKSHFVLIVGFLGVIVAFVASYQIE